MGRGMLARFWEQGIHIVHEAGAEWRVARVAFLVAVVAVIAARLLRLPALAAAACGLGAAAGWAVLSNLPAWPHTMADRLPELALLALLFAYLAELPRFRGSPPAMIAVLGLLSGWWLAGAPQSLAALGHAWPSIAIVAAWTGAVALLLAEADGWRVAAAAFALWAALHAIDAPTIWILLALVPAGAALGALPASGGPLTRLPAAAGTGAVAGGAVAAAGLLRHGRVGPLEFACLAPLAVALVGARLLPRLHRLGGVAMPVAGLLALLGVVLLTYTAAALAGLR
jgi:hypothetical protein